MAVTIAGAVRQNKIYPGKQMKIRTQDQQEWLTKVEELSRDAIALKLLAPSILPPGVFQQEAVTVSFLVPGDATYSFLADVALWQDEVFRIELNYATPLERIEQRTHFRLETSKLIYVAVKKDGEDGWGNLQEASLLDISRGGASILSPVKVSTGSDFLVWIPLDEVDYVVEAVSRVVRVTEGLEGQILIGVSFKDLPLLDQERILDYILQRMDKKER